MLKRIIFIILIAAVGYHFLYQSPEPVDVSGIPELKFSYSDSLNIDAPPIQNKLDGSVRPINHGEYRITPLASFQVAARVLSVKHYSFGRESSLSPVDLALGWGPMSKDEVLNTLDISQSNRFYFWHTDNFIIPRRKIETNSANMHFIPATTEVEKKLKQINKDDRIRFKGYLVRIDADDGWHWVSSQTRNDTGDGACEVILVDDIKLL